MVTDDWSNAHIDVPQDGGCLIRDPGAPSVCGEPKAGTLGLQLEDGRIHDVPVCAHHLKLVHLT